MTILSNRWDGTEESAQWTNSAINAVIDTLVNADMWTGDPPYRGKSPAEQVQMLIDERNALRAKLDAVPVASIARLLWGDATQPGYIDAVGYIGDWLIAEEAVQP